MIVADREIACDADDHVVTTATVVGAGAPQPARRRARQALDGRRHPRSPSVSPQARAPTSGAFALTVHGQNFGRVGQSVQVLDRRARRRSTARSTASAADGARDVAVCAKAPVGAGADLEVRDRRRRRRPRRSAARPTRARLVVRRADRARQRDAARRRAAARSASAASNFGPSFVEKKVTLRIGGAERACARDARHARPHPVRRAGRLAARASPITVEVAQPALAPVAREFSYRRPDIVSTTRPHWRGGHVYIRGYNFGKSDSKAVERSTSATRSAATRSSRRRTACMRCYAPPGAADGKFHHLTVRVDGVSSVMPTKDGEAPRTDDRVQYTNTAPAVPRRRVAPLHRRRRLDAQDPPADARRRRRRGLLPCRTTCPPARNWRHGDGYMQIDYNAPHDLVSVPAAPSTDARRSRCRATDGPGVDVEARDRRARARLRLCELRTRARTSRALSAHTTCARAARSPTSCAARRAARSSTRPRATATPIDHVAPAQRHRRRPCARLGYTFAVDRQRAPAARRRREPARSARCISLRRQVAASPPPARSRNAGERAHVRRGRAVPARAAARRLARPCTVQGRRRLRLDHGLYLTLPTHDGRQQRRLRPLPRRLRTRPATDVALRRRAPRRARTARSAAACTTTAATRSCTTTCPDHANPEQHDRDQDGDGDICQGGATGCVDCHSYDALNVKYLRVRQPEHRELEHDTCAKNQCPTIITTEDGDRFDARP
jgi:hypothetical protein